MLIIGNQEDREELQRQLGEALQEEIRLCLLPYDLDWEGDIDIQLARKAIRIVSTPEAVSIIRGHELEYEIKIIPCPEGVKLERVSFINLIQDVNTPAKQLIL
jgi:hypothetical protein